jgi:hypothetical protein
VDGDWVVVVVGLVVIVLTDEPSLTSLDVDAAVVVVAAVVDDVDVVVTESIGDDEGMNDAIIFMGDDVVVAGGVPLDGSSDDVGEEVSDDTSTVGSCIPSSSSLT